MGRKKDLMMTAAMIMILLMTACGSGNSGTADIRKKLGQEKNRTEAASAAETEETQTAEALQKTTAPAVTAAVTSAVRKTPERKTAEDPVKNNGGLYVRVGDDYWFRFYTVEANEPTALWGDFTDHPVPGSAKQMKCLKKDGSLVDAFTDTGYGKIWYIDGLFYLTQRDNNTQSVTDHIYTVRPDGSGKKTIANGEIVAYDPVSRKIVISTRSAADGSHVLVSRSIADETGRELLPGESGEMTFHAIKDGKVLFDRTDYSAEPATVSLYCADLAAEKTVKLADLPAQDEYGDHVKVFETVFGKDADTVYYSWGFLGGTALEFQSGAVASVRLSDPLNETYLTALPYSGLFHVNEDSGTLEYETSVTEESEMCFKAVMDMKTGKAVTDTEQLTSDGTHLPYEPYYDRWNTGGLCMDTEFLKKTVVVPNVIPDPGSDAAGIVTDIKNAEYADGKIFYAVNTSLVNSGESVGWRTAYTLQHTALYAADVKSGTTQALCQSTAGTPQEGEGGENAETDRLGFVKEYVLDGDHGWFWFKPMLWIDGTDTAALKKYGIDPAGVDNDYVMVDTGEPWKRYEWTMYDTKFTVQYDKDRNNVTPNRKVGIGEFGTYMETAPEIGDWVADSAQEKGILADVTIAGSNSSRAVRVDEVYVP